MRLTQPVFADPYSRNRLTGGMILIDEATNTTVGTVMITEAQLSAGCGRVRPWAGQSEPECAFGSAGPFGVGVLARRGAWQAVSHDAR